jgi:hypothetical protein
LRSGAIGQRSFSVSAPLSTPRSVSVLISPSWRTIGGEPAEMWRSEPFMTTIVRSSSSIAAVVPSRTGRPAAAATAGAAAATLGATAGRLPHREAGMGAARLRLRPRAHHADARELEAPLRLARGQALPGLGRQVRRHELVDHGRRLLRALHFPLARRRHDHHAAARDEPQLLSPGLHRRLQQSLDGH